MNLRQLVAFREVMLTGSVSEAARNLNRTQPAVSAQIAGLEEQMGFKLFARRDGRLHPVPEAQYLLSEASDILNRVSTVSHTFEGLREMESGSIHIVAMPGPSVFLLPELVSQFLEDRTDINVSLISRSSFQVQQLVSAQRYDLGLLDHDPDVEPSSSLLDYTLLSFDCLCAVPADDPLADRKFVTVDDLNRRPMATLREEHSTTRQIRALFEQRNLHFNRRIETQYFIPLLTFVEKRLAYAIVDPLTAQSYRLYRGESRQLVFRPFRPNVKFSAALVTPSHRQLSRVATAFVKFLENELNRIQAERAD